MKPGFFAALILFAMAMLISVPVQAEPDARFYVAPGLGIGGAGSETGLAYGLNLTIMSGWTVFSIRAIGCSQIAIFGRTSSSSDYSFLVGFREWTRMEQASVELGVGYVQISKRGEPLVSYAGFFEPSYEQIHGSAAGLSWQAQFYHRATGLVIYGNFNKVQSFAGGMFCLRFGRW